MEIPSSSEKSPCKPSTYRNISYPPTPLLDEEPFQPTIQIISYDHAMIPSTPLMLVYDLQNKFSQPRHIRIDPLEGVSRSAMVALQREPHYISLLQAAEEEIRNAMGCLISAKEVCKRSLSDSSGEVVAEWVGRLGKGDTDEVVLYDFEREYEYFEEKIPTVRVGCSCLTGCYKSVAFAVDLASRPWPKEWVVDVEHRSILASV